MRDRNPEVRLTETCTTPHKRVFIHGLSSDKSLLLPDPLFLLAGDPTQKPEVSPSKEDLGRSQYSFTDSFLELSAKPSGVARGFGILTRTIQTVAVCRKNFKVFFRKIPLPDPQELEV